MLWTVEFSHKAAKQTNGLKVNLLATLDLLVADLQQFGPAPGKQWPNYSKLKGYSKHFDKRHCHLIKGKPTYVCCWEVVNKKVKIIEIYYVGTHEKAPY